MVPVVLVHTPLGFQLGPLGLRPMGVEQYTLGIGGSCGCPIGVRGRVLPDGDCRRHRRCRHPGDRHDQYRAATNRTWWEDIKPVIFGISLVGLGLVVGGADLVSKFIGKWAATHHTTSRFTDFACSSRSDSLCWPGIFAFSWNPLPGQSACARGSQRSEPERVCSLRPAVLWRGVRTPLTPGVPQSGSEPRVAQSTDPASRQLS